MPIDNTLFGVWKTFRYGGNYYVVESADESVSQEVAPKNYIMGTAMPRVMLVKGAEASLSMTAPLLVCSGVNSSPIPVWRTGVVNADPVNDGLTLIKTLGAITNMNGSFTADPFFIYKSISFSVSADEGASYTVSALGDYDALASENTTATNGFGLITPGAGQYPMADLYAFRVASFYDFDVSLGGITLGVGSYLKDLKVDMDYSIEDFSWIGQPDQRKYYGMAGFSAKVSGTIISSTRQPSGHSMPLQAEKPGIVLPAPWTGLPLNQGGFAWPTTGTFAVYLRNSVAPGGGPVDILPQTNSSVGQRFIFSTSSLQATTGLLTTKFEGQLWAQTNS